MALVIASVVAPSAARALETEAFYFDVPAGSHPHDVAAVPHGPIVYTAQRTGKLGILHPETGKVEEVALGTGSAPHGVIIGPDRAAWITDGGQNAIVRVNLERQTMQSWPLPKDWPNVNLNTAAFDRSGRLWFTGQAGFYGRLDPKTNDIQMWKAPGGSGPYGITATPAGEVYYASLAGSHIVRVNVETGAATVIEPPTPKQGARRVWSDSKGRIWTSYWNTGQVGRYDPSTGQWREWKLPGNAHAYAVWVDETDKVWLTDWSSNALVRFDPVSGRFDSFKSDRDGARVRQLLGRTGEVWGAESGLDRLVVIQTH
jgi:virginiamycin B lyase